MATEKPGGDSRGGNRRMSGGVRRGAHTWRGGGGNQGTTPDHGCQNVAPIIHARLSLLCYSTTWSTSDDLWSIQAKKQTSNNFFATSTELHQEIY